MYQVDDFQRSMRRGPDGLGSVSPAVRARHAITRVQQILDDAPTGLSLNPAHLFPALNSSLAEPGAEAERCFALGWLHWLNGDSDLAEPLLAAATDRLLPNTVPGMQAAYWLARTRLAGRAVEALAAFEKSLRAAQGSPLATCCFVDLLWRGGRGERAEQVWKSVRVNKRVTDCDAACLQEARFHIRQGDLAEAEKGLQAASPKGAPTQGERVLLLAWLAVARRQTEAARNFLEAAQGGVLPVRARDAWRMLFARKFGTVLNAEDPLPALRELEKLPLSEPVRRYLEGQLGRENRASAIAAYRAALASSSQPYARYALACFGEEDFAALLASMPGTFLATRCRYWVSLHRYCCRDLGVDELQTALSQAGAAGYSARGLDDWSLIVRESTVSSADNRIPDQDLEPGNVSALNRRRMKFDAILRRMTPELALTTLVQVPCSDDAELAQQVGRQLLRLLLCRTEVSANPTTDEVLTIARRALGPSSLPDVALGLLNPANAPTLTAGRAESLAERLWRHGVCLARGEPLADVNGAAPQGMVGALDQMLRVFALARQGDFKGLCSALQTPCAWNLLATGPPAFVARALLGVDAGMSLERWSEIVSQWLSVWPAEALNADARRLAEQFGLLAADPASGIDESTSCAWILHQAARAIDRGDASASIALLRRAAPEAEPAMASVLSHLERLARMQWLAAVAQFDPSHPLTPPGLYADLWDALGELPDGQKILAVPAGSDHTSAREQLCRLADRELLPVRLAHPLAVVFHRAACAFDECDADAADDCWQRSWRCWLTWAAGQPVAGLQSLDAAVPILLGHLLELQRNRMTDLLARSDMDRARRRWERLSKMPALVPAGCAALTALVQSLYSQFRDDLATDYLLATRETMRHGAAPEGWRADYEQGLSFLRRLLSLEKANERLLTALIEICGDWFLDLYNTQDSERMRLEVERYTPFAMQLARTVTRSVESRVGDLPARAALSEFFKFRGFIADDRDRKKELYRAALEFNPANENVRNLLDALEPSQ